MRGAPSVAAEASCRTARAPRRFQRASRRSTRAQHGPQRRNKQPPQLAVVLTLTTRYALARPTMLGLELRAIAAALVSLQVSAGFLGAHRGLPLAERIIQTAYRSRIIILIGSVKLGRAGGAARRGGNLGEPVVDFHRFSKPLGAERLQWPEFLGFSVQSRSSG